MKFREFMQFHNPSSHCFFPMKYIGPYQNYIMLINTINSKQ